MAVKRKNKQTGLQFCVYLGPSIRGAIQYGAIIQGTHHEAVKQYAQLIETYPPVRNLIIPGEMLSEARVQIKTSGNALFAYNQRLTAMLKAGKIGG